MTSYETVLVGFGGFAYAGKDEGAAALESIGFVNLGSFSIGLNECLLILDPWVPFDATLVKEMHTHSMMRYRDLFEACGGYEGYGHFKEHPEVRRLLQFLGTEVGRKKLGPDIWVDVKSDEVRAAFEKSDLVCLTAVRYPNELEMLGEFPPSLAIWIERPGYGPVNDHSSDNSLSANDFDVTVVNEGSLDDLHRAVIRAVVDFMKERGIGDVPQEAQG